MVGEIVRILSTDGEAWKIRDLPPFTTICGLRFTATYTRRDSLEYKRLCRLRYALTRRNCSRQGKTSEGNEAVVTYGDLTESMF